MIINITETKLSVNGYDKTEVTYRIAQEVYFMYNNKVKIGKIKELKISEERILIRTDDGDERNSKDIFFNKSDLLASL